ncbi:TPA: homogentisate 1,2-dioxygenase [Pseudomonas aeruginosa]|nr:homogentisate 1,2-dioxygenase [Pseudomonas aeruginosa]HCF1525221.1 homogentisate 1,2-dioxygenase [Pseudomonas aeruginosa]
MNAITSTSNDLQYQVGFGNQFSTEAVAGALPIGRNSPQKHPLGLYTELLSGAAFTAPRATNQRTWLYRIRPSAMMKPLVRLDNRQWKSGPFNEVEVPASRLRWSPLPTPTEPTDFVDGIFTIAGNGCPQSQSGVAIHVYTVTKSMSDRYLVNADGDMFFVPQHGRLVIHTEMGKLTVEPLEIAVVPRGVSFRVDLDGDVARGYLCENYGAAFALPELGPIGSNGLANARDFMTPVASYEDRSGPVTLVTKFMGNLWTSQQEHSPLNVVAWHGNYVPYKYDLRRFMAIGTVTYDHPDPSINTVLTSKSEVPGTANLDFAIFPPRWLVAENTFRPPWFHRNVMSELAGLVEGVYDAKAEGFVPGGISLHNSFMPHGPDKASYDMAVAADLQPHRLDNTMAVLFESRYVFRPTAQALEHASLQKDYDAVWDGFEANFGSK